MSEGVSMIRSAVRRGALLPALALSFLAEAQPQCTGEFADDAATQTSVRAAFAVEGLLAQRRLSDAEALSVATIDQAVRGGVEDPKLLPALYDLHGQVLGARGRFGEAHQAAETGLDALLRECPIPGPQARRLLVSLGALDRELSKLSEAEEHLSAVVESVDWHTESRVGATAAEQLSRVFRDTGRPLRAKAMLTTARRALQEAISIFADARETATSAVAIVTLELASAEVALENLSAADALVAEAQQGLEPADRYRIETAALLSSQIAQRRSAFSLARATAARILAETQLPSVRTLAHERLGLIAVATADPLVAEQHFEQALSGFEATLPGDHVDRARQLHNLGLAYAELGQTRQSRAYFDSAIEIFRRRGAVSYEAGSMLEKGLMLVNRRSSNSEDNSVEAIEAGTEALRLLESLEERDEVRMAFAHSTLGFAYRRADDLAEAERHFLLTIELLEGRRGLESFDLAPGLTELAEIYLLRGEYGLAVSYANRAIAIRRQGNARTPRGLAVSQSVLARVFAAQGEWDDALAVADEYIEIMKRRFEISQTVASGYALGEQKSWEDLFAEYLWIAHNAYSADGPLTEREAAALIDVAQYPHLDPTASVFAELVDRYQSSDARSSTLLRDRQAATEQWRLLDLGLANAVGSNVETEVELRSQLTRQQRELEARIDELDVELKERGVSVDGRARPISLRDLRRALDRDELLLLQLSGTQGTFVAAIAKDGAPEIFFSSLDANSLVGLVQEVRRSTVLPRSGPPPAFAATAAHEIYDRLLAPLHLVERRLAHLIVVQDSRLQNIPLSLLPTDIGADPRYLGHEIPISVLPSASSLVDLRLDVDRPPPTAEFLGIYPDSDNPDIVAAAVREVYTVASRLRAPDRPAHQMLGSEQALFGAGQDEVLSLVNYRVVLLATHGYLTGDAGGRSEPGLLISDSESGDYDGYLALSEVHRLRLRADLVVLSACNTAGADGLTSGDAFSGLTRAFLQAGSRSLLVSHWAVSSDATTDLMVRVAEHGTVKRAEALRSAMHDLSLNPRYRHPAFWAPFVFVGDGA